MARVCFHNVSQFLIRETWFPVSVFVFKMQIMLALHDRKFYRESEHASTHLIFASNSSNGQILRALSSYMGPFDTPYFWPAKFYQPCIITISEPQYLLFYSADCKCTAVIRQRLEMPHFSIVTKISTTQRLTRGESVLRLFNILGGIHSKLENYGFHKQNFDYYRF